MPTQSGKVKFKFNFATQCLCDIIGTFYMCDSVGMLFSIVTQLRFTAHVKQTGVVQYGNALGAAQLAGTAHV